MNLEKLKDSLRKHEGVMTQPYKCPAGFTTIGVGHNLDAKGLPHKIIEALLEMDIEDCAFDLDREHPTWRAHSDNRQNVLAEMCFNLGMLRLNMFHRMWGALDRRDYETAAREMLASVWAQQVGNRAETLAEQMRKG